jgi:hypothetical protein
MNPRGGFATGSAFPNVTELMVCGEYYQKEPDPVKNAVDSVLNAVGGKLTYCEHDNIRDFCPECAPLR